MSCSTYGLKSVGSNDVRQLIVVNDIHDRSANLYWIDFNGEKVHYATIPPGGRHVQSTYAGHVWCSDNSFGYCDIVFVVHNNVEIIIR